ncbi:MATH and LRR domain-containing protein PFE0570w [Lucilia cuprina]|uniref:MATH and LRR domain-containing protein PFE0570w n=1 Tax=Lucilia cuprina TaxID=7375 RepID=UPI001F0545F9|nr:MATH and LRR domain-containing protein PFE0570w [Lucilia cuprina]
MPSITSPQEKEKLRKRLQKLFQRQEYLEESGAGKPIKMKKNKQPKINQIKEQLIEGQKKQQVKGDKLKENQTKTVTKNLKKQQPVQNKSSTIDDCSKQNGFVKSPKKTSVENENVTFGENKTKLKVTKLKNKPQNFPITKTEKENTKNSPTKQQIKAKSTKIVEQEKLNKVMNKKTNAKNSPNTKTKNVEKTNNNKKDSKRKEKEKEKTSKNNKPLQQSPSQKGIEKKTITTNKKQSSQNPPKQEMEKETISKNKKKLKQPQQHKIEKEMTNKVKNDLKQKPKTAKENVKKTLAESTNKSQQKSQVQQQTPIKKKNNSTGNNVETKMNNNQKKKAKKRAASENSLKEEDTITTKKKPKLANASKETKQNTSKKSNQIKVKKPQDKNITHVSLCSNLQNELDDDSEAEDKFDINGMTGCVMGGDFDTDNEEEDDMEWNYWNKEENSSYEEDDDDDDDISIMEINSEDLTPEEAFNGDSQTQLEQYENNESMGSEEEYYDSEDYDDYYSDSGDDEEEEEEEDYSDFDENDYEEDEDSYNYSMDSEDDYSSNYNNSSYDFHDVEDDDDYELPKHIPEDLIIHRGTATKHDLKPEHNVSFDSENEDAQIIEIEEQNTVKIINQPKGYEKEELLKLKYEEKSLKTLTFHKKEETITRETTINSDTEDCPKLVPIVDEDGFQLYNPNEETDDEDDGEVEDELEEEQNYDDESMEEYEHNDDMDDGSLGSEYTEINSDDADSLLSQDINEKYLNRGPDDTESDYSIDENIWNKKHKVDVIDATGYECERKADKTEDHTDIKLNDDIKQIPSLKLYENVDLKTKSSILSTTIINKKLFQMLDDVKENKINILTNKSTKERSNLMEQEMQVETEPKPIAVKEANVEEIQQNVKILEAQEEQQPNKVVKSTGQSLVDYKTKFFNALDSNSVIVLLKDPFYLYGTIRLTLLAGNVQVYGHDLKVNSEVEIFSPRGCSQIEISPSSVRNKQNKENLEQTLKSFEQHFALNDLKAINDNYQHETDAVVLLKRNEGRKKLVQQFKKFMNENVFPNINNINNERPLYNTEYLLRCMINTSVQEQKCLRLPQQWQQINITNKSRVMLVGGKSVGKSTLLRYLINRLLPQKVLLIDLDIGQPEVFVPQTVSCTVVEQPLLGPGFMLNMQPEISFAVGHTNIALCAYKYMAAVRALIAHCKSQEAYNNMPWLINTMGYNKGFGLELISAIAQELPLTDLIQLQSSKEINNFDSILHAHVLSQVPRIMFSEQDGEIPNYRLHVWQSAVQQESRYQKEWEMSAKDIRYAMLLARLSQALQGHAEWLTDIKPLSASLNELKIVNLMENNGFVSKEELAKSAEANLVYLCHHQDDDKPLKCLGIGVVRAIDFHVQQVYLIPALPYNQLKEVNCLALGEMPLPTSIFTNQGWRVKNTAPFVYNTIAANASKAIKQIYHRPRKFLTGKHKTLD